MKSIDSDKTLTVYAVNNSALQFVNSAVLSNDELDDVHA